jgi:hypothetical protein
MGIFIMKKEKTKQQRLDYFAGLAMQSLIAKIEKSYEDLDEDEISVVCYVAKEFGIEMIYQIDNEQI